MSLCPACQGDSASLLGEAQNLGEKFPLVRCRRCDLVFVFPRPAAEKIHAYYLGKDESAGCDSLIRKADNEKQLYQDRFRKRLVQIRRFVPRPGRMLDVGCQLGLFLGEARQQGWRVYGVELTPEAADFARKHAQATIFTGELTSAGFPSGHFDVVTCWHLIEHVLDPVALLKEACRILKPEGLLALETPNIDSQNFRRQELSWEYVIPPEHINYFNPASLAQALRQAGFAPCFKAYDQGTGVGQALEQVGMGAVRHWVRRHYRWVALLRRLYIGTVGYFSPQQDILVMFARCRKNG